MDRSPSEFLQSRLSSLPRDPFRAATDDVPEELEQAEALEELEDDEEEETDGFDAGGSIGRPAQQRSSNARHTRQDVDEGRYGPLSAEGYFSEALEISLASSEHGGSVRVYLSPPKIKEGNGTVAVMHHGAGFSALSFACVAREIQRLTNGELGVLAFDCRAHGKTTLQPEDDMCLDRLSQDLVSLLATMYSVRSEAPHFLLIGHSMGGTVVADAANRIQVEVGPVAGVVLMDVVEETALHALSGMRGIIDRMPTGFPSAAAAIQWHVKSGTLRNLDSARLSVPPLLREDPDETDEGQRYKWRTDLRATEQHWRGWFTGLSDKFLGCRTARMQMLASNDRLDKTLLVAQMQGKFQQVILPSVGHCLQEDAPTETAQTLVDFWKRNQRLPIGIRKVV